MHDASRRPVLNVTLWGLQFLLALIFLAHGVFLLAPPASMIEQINASIAPAFRIFIGVAEVLAAVGLILPGITRVLPWLVSGAAAGLAFVMLCATVLHVVRAEIGSAFATALLLAMSVYVAYARWKVLPILPRIV